MSWWNPFKKTQDAPAAQAPQAATAAAAELPAKGLMGAFYRKWKDPVFLKQLRVLASHMQKDGVNIKDMKAVQAWLDKNKDAVEAGKFKEEPAGAGSKVETFVKTEPDVGRNEPCPCGSGKKYKKCCAAKAG